MTLAPDKLAFARKLRREQTEAEARVWACLRNRRLNGYKFRRQVPIGPYVADFVCEATKTVVELDGSQHEDRRDYDAARTDYLEGKGYRVFRFWNSDLDERDGVLDNLVTFMETRP